MKKAVLMELGVLGLGIMIGGLSLSPLARTNQTDSEAMETYPRTSSVTQHKMTLDGEPLSYKATTGFLPYYNKKGKKRTQIFYTAYTRERIPRTSTRPLTIVCGGGPGISSIYLHIGGFGPKVVPLGNGINLPRPPYKVVDNKNTLLGMTDLVFVDPVGTGFSEVIEEGKEELFWGLEEDVDSMAEFIRIYLARNGRWKSPLFIAGGSHGGIRTARLCARLQDMGIHLAGIILISPALRYTSLIDVPGNDIPYIHNLSAMAVAAWYHQKIDARYRKVNLDGLVEEVRSWAEHEYAAALWQGNALPEAKYTEVARQLAAYTGLSEEMIRAHNLRVPMYRFLGTLLQKERRSISFYDSRVTAHSIDFGEYTFMDDPIAVNTFGPLYTAFNNYLEENLQFSTDRKYIAINRDIGDGSDGASGMPAGGRRYPGTFASLATALRKANFLRVFVAIGLFDMACVHDATVYEIHRMDLPRKILDNITVTTYPTGHMVYLDPSSHQKLKENLLWFYQGLKTTRFSNYNWWVKTSRQRRTGPESNYFSDSKENVWVDSEGRLHLKITRRNGKWYGAEVFSEKSFGYGKYIFYLTSRVEELDQNVVLGFFTWDNPPDYNHREIDIEFSRWGKQKQKNTQFVIQPWTHPANIHRFDVQLKENYSTHSFDWRRESIFFQSLYGHRRTPPNEGYIIESWNYAGRSIPRPGNEKTRINLWLSKGNPPSDNRETEVVIEKFEFIPP